jgi:hypothetical protein
VDNEPEIIEEEEAEGPPAAEKRSLSNAALTIVLVALILWFGFQAFQLVRDRGNLGMVKSNQEVAMQESEKLSSQFQALLTKIAGLANRGHAGAKMLLDELKKTGVGVSPEERPAETPDLKSKTK